MSKCKEKSLVRRVISAENAMRRLLQRIFYNDDNFSWRRDSNNAANAAIFVFNHKRIGANPHRYRDHNIMKLFDVILRDVYTGEYVYFAFESIEYSISNVGFYLSLKLDPMVNVEKILLTPIGTMLNAQVDGNVMKLYFRAPAKFDDVRTVKFNYIRSYGKYTVEYANEIVERHFKSTRITSDTDIDINSEKNKIFKILNSITSKQQTQITELSKNKNELVAKRDALDEEIGEIIIRIAILENEIKMIRDDILKSVANFEITS